jgi:hypothetical protein
MEHISWDAGSAAPHHPIIELPNGDVWVADVAVPGGRRFRYHLGHVVEVFDSGRVRRVGPGLGYARPWLLADGPLDAVIERALADGEAERQSDGPSWPESAGATDLRQGMSSQGLLGRLAALLHRSHPAPGRDEPVSPWRDTMPWTRQG